MNRFATAALISLAFACSEDPADDNADTDPWEDAQRANAEWDAYVAANNACTTAEDCVVIPTGCVISCYDAVAADKEEEALVEAARVMELANEANQDCAACPDPGEVRCEANACTMD